MSLKNKLIVGCVFVGIGVIPSVLLDKGNSKILPYEHGGLPNPFMTELVDDNRDGTPDRVLLHSIGPMFYNGQEREPTQAEIDWYREQNRR